MKLTYWVCAAKDDDRCYSIRTTTRKAAIAERDLLGHEYFEPPVKVIVTYKSAFDLLYKCQSEGGLDESGE